MEFVKKHKKQIVVISLMCLGVVVGVAFYQSTAQAAWWEFWKPSGDDEKAAADFLGKYGKYLQYSDNPIKSMLHTLGWGMVTLFYHIVTLIEDCLDGANLLSLFSFVDGKNATIHGIYGSVMNVVVWSVLALSLVLVGYKLMVGKQSDLKNLTVNIFLSVGLLVLMPTLFGVGQFSGQAFSKGLFNDVKALNTSDKKPNESLAFGLIKQNTTDWAYVSQKNKWDDVKKGKNVNQLDENDFSAGVYPLSNLITSKSAKELDTKQGKLLQYHLSKNDDNKTKPVKDSSVAAWAPKSFQNGYFQYTLTSTIGVLIGLAALAVAVLFNAFVIVRAIVELAMKRILAPVIFASDIETLQKSKMILSDIMKCYLTIGLTELGMVLFNFWVTYVNGKNMNLLLKVVCFVAGVSFLINGSTSVQRYFGIDIGLQDGKSGWMAALGVGTAIGKGSKAIKSTVDNAAGTTVAAVAGGVSGIVSGLQKGAGMKLSQQAEGGSENTNGSSNQPQESLSERQATESQRQDSKQKPENTNIQARKPSLARKMARSAGHKIQSAAETQMQKHPTAAKLGSVTGGIAGGSAGLAVRAGKKLSGLDQSPASQQGTTVKNASSQARSDAAKTVASTNDPLKRNTDNLSQRQAEQKPEAQQQEQEFPQERLEQPETEAYHQQKQEQNPEALSQRQNDQQEQLKEDHRQPETPTEATQAGTSVKVAQVQAETPQTSQQTEITPAGTRDYSQIVQPTTTTTTTTTTGGSPVTMGQTSVQPTETKQSTVQKQKRPETPLTKPDDNVLNNPWSNVQNDRS